jgi:hypothetical protein
MTSTESKENQGIEYKTEYPPEKCEEFPLEQEPLVSDPGQVGVGFRDGYPQQQQQQHQQPIIIYQQQPQNVVYVPAQKLDNPPKDYLCLNIFATLCCCWIIGIFAILKSVQCRSAISAGDRATAEQKSKQARKYWCCTVWIGVSTFIIIVVLNVLLALYKIYYQ